jgi:hypothetical protein
MSVYAECSKTDIALIILWCIKCVVHYHCMIRKKSCGQMFSSRYAMLQLTSNDSVLTSDPISLYRHSESLIYFGSSTQIVKILGDEYEEFQPKFFI